MWCVQSNRTEGSRAAPGNGRFKVGKRKRKKLGCGNYADRAAHVQLHRDRGLRLLYKWCHLRRHRRDNTIPYRMRERFAYMFMPGIPGPPKAFSGGLIAPP